MRVLLDNKNDIFFIIININIGERVNGIIFMIWSPLFYKGLIVCKKIKRLKWSSIFILLYFIVLGDVLIKYFSGRPNNG